MHKHIVTMIDRPNDGHMLFLSKSV